MRLYKKILRTMEEHILKCIQKTIRMDNLEDILITSWYAK